MIMNTVKTILVPRLYATSFSRDKRLSRVLHSFFGKVIEIKFKENKIIFFFLGCGQKIRKIPNSIINKINSGEITDIVDIGGGGALDSELRKGDLILSTNDYAINGELLKVKRRPEVERIARELADEIGSKFYKGNILTSNKVIYDRDERLRLQRKLGCKVVQMEHFWFADALKKSVSKEAYDNLYFTHIELISDEVPVKDPSVIRIISDFCGALDLCVFRNQKHLGQIKSRFLKRFIDY